MIVRAHQKYVRIAPRKLRLIADLIRGKELHTINTTLSVLNKRGAQVMNEVIRQAVANAVNNLGLSEQQLSLKSVVVDEGPTYKRVRAASRGRAKRILKRSSHILVELNVQETVASDATAPAIMTPKVEKAPKTKKAETEEKAEVLAQATAPIQAKASREAGAPLRTTRERKVRTRRTTSK